ELYRLTKNFPSAELYGLTNQMRRAAVSIPSNIAEGAARGSNNDYIRFLYISLASLAELDTQLLIAKNLGYLTVDSFKDLQNELTEINKMLNGLIRYRKSRK